MIVIQLPKKCKVLQNALQDCKASQISQRARFTGTRGVNDHAMTDEAAGNIGKYMWGGKK